MSAEHVQARPGVYADSVTLMQVSAKVGAVTGVRSAPLQFALVGPGQPDLTVAAEAALRATGTAVPDWPRWGAGAAGPAVPRAGTGTPAGARRESLAPPAASALRGLFAGGTLCDEAMVGWPWSSR